MRNKAPAARSWRNPQGAGEVNPERGRPILHQPRRIFVQFCEQRALRAPGSVSTVGLSSRAFAVCHSCKLDRAISTLNLSRGYGDNIMIIGSPRISSRVWLFDAVAALGLMAVSLHLPLRVNAQTVPAQTAPARRSRQELPPDSVAKVGATDSVATIHVDVTPEHVLNTIYPDTATGAWMDDLSKKQVDNLTKPETIQAVKNLGWGSITMRNNIELRLAAWHWNENGTWSDPATKSA